MQALWYQTMDGSGQPDTVTFSSTPSPSKAIMSAGDLSISGFLPERGERERGREGKEGGREGEVGGGGWREVEGGRGGKEVGRKGGREKGRSNGREGEEMSGRE